MKGSKTSHFPETGHSRRASRRTAIKHLQVPVIVFCVTQKSIRRMKRAVTGLILDCQQDLNNRSSN